MKVIFILFISLTLLVLINPIYSLNNKNNFSKNNGGNGNSINIEASCGDCTMNGMKCLFESQSIKEKQLCSIKFDECVFVCQEQLSKFGENTYNPNTAGSTSANTYNPSSKSISSSQNTYNHITSGEGFSKE